jgi:hypothetical protein
MMMLADILTRAQKQKETDLAKIYSARGEHENTKNFTPQAYKFVFYRNTVW